jgi:hypothetical protein
MILNKNDQLLELTRFERDLKTQKEEILRDQEEEFLHFSDNLREREGLELHKFIEKHKKDHASQKSEQAKLLKEREGLYKAQLAERRKIDLELLRSELSKEAAMLESRLKEEMKSKMDVFKLKLDNEAADRSSQGVTEFNIRRLKLEKEIQDEKDLQERFKKKMQTTEELMLEEVRRLRKRNDEDLNRKIEDYRETQETIMRNKAETQREKASELVLLERVNEINTEIDRRVKLERENQEKNLKLALLRQREKRELKMSEEVDEAYKSYEPDRIAYIEQSKTQASTQIQKRKYELDLEMNKEFELNKKYLYDLSKKRLQEFNRDLEKLDCEKATFKEDIEDRMIYLEKARAKLFTETSHIDIDIEIIKVARDKHFEKIEQLKKEIDVWKTMKTTKVKEMTDQYKSKQKELKRLKEQQKGKTDKLERLIHEFKYLITQQKISRPPSRRCAEPRPRSIEPPRLEKENLFSMNEAFSFEEETKQVDLTSSDLIDSKYKAAPLRFDSKSAHEDRIKTLHEDTLQLPNDSELNPQDLRYNPRREDPWIIENISSIQEASRPEIKTHSPTMHVYKKYLGRESRKQSNLKQTLRRHSEWLSGVVQEVMYI